MSAASRTTTIAERTRTSVAPRAIAIEVIALRCAHRAARDRAADDAWATAVRADAAEAGAPIIWISVPEVDPIREADACDAVAAARLQGLAASHAHVVCFMVSDASGLRTRSLPQLAAQIGRRMNHRVATSTSPCRMSVIIPAKDASATLPAVLAALRGGTLPRTEYEIIVVDAGSQDGTAMLASREADIIIRLPSSRYGATYARNRGAELARGAVVVFLDADAILPRDALERMSDALSAEPAVAVVVASTAAAPAAHNAATRYAAALARHDARELARAADNFASACCAMRTPFFFARGMFDEWHCPESAAADIAFGEQCASRGDRIHRAADIEVGFAKPCTRSALLRKEFADRVVPSVRLLGPLWPPPRSALAVALRRPTRFATLAAVAIGSVAFAARPGSGAATEITAGIALLVILVELSLARRWWKHGGARFALAAGAMHLAVQCVRAAGFGWGALLHLFLGPPVPHALVEAWSEVNHDVWPPLPRRSPRPEIAQ